MTTTPRSTAGHDGGDRLTESAPVVPPPRPVSIRHILLPVAGGPSEQAAIDYAAVLAVALRARITLLHVEQPPSAMVAMVPGASVAGDLAADGVAWTTWLEGVAVALSARGADNATHVLLVAPGIAAAVVDFAREHAVDLIVMATHAVPACRGCSSAASRSPCSGRRPAP